MKKQAGTIKQLTLITIFLFVAFSFIVYQRTHKQRIFILHSYHPSMTWVKGLETGVSQVFSKRRYVDIRHFYMNSKRKHSPAYLKRISQEALKAIKLYQPDIVIVFDTIAQRYVATKLVNKPQFKVVVAGVIESHDLAKFENATNVTGVLEVIPVKAIREVLGLMMPSKNRVFYLSDDSHSAKQLDKDVPQQDWGEFNLIAHKRSKTFKEWQQAVKQAQTKADILLISTYQTVHENGKPLSPIKLIQWTLANSNIPVIGLYESFINDGGYLAISVTSFEQGYTAAKIALFLLERKIKIQELSFVKSQMFQLQMRKHMALKLYPQIQIPIILEAFSKTKWQLDDLMINKQLSKTIQEQNKSINHQQK